ncbi:MAG: hypothetical protein DRJ03_26950 [Chloroflexi bacterium]|nr:MAG: hypothetical protein DRJ03_26950 [Chloroflexota bacterium]
MKRWGYWVSIGAVLLAVVALIGWARAYIPLRTPSASEEWSRGRLLSVTPVNVRPDAYTAPDGGTFLSWVDLNNQLHVARLGARGQIVSNWTPSLGTGIPREPRLLVGPGGETHLVWRETSEERSLLTYAQVNSSGLVQVGPLTLSPAGDKVQSPSLIFNQRGEIEVFWIGQAGVYQATLSAEGEMQKERVLLVKDGESAGIVADRAGDIHLVWLENAGPNMRVIYYASFDPDQKALSQPEEMTRLFLRTGQVVQDPVIGLDLDTGYILWVIQDLKYVTSSAQYAFFPLEIPRQKKVRDLQLENGGNPLSLWAARGQRETLLVALTETVIASDGPQLQVGVVALHGEQSSGDQARVGNFGLADSGAGIMRHRIVSPIALHLPLHTLSHAGNSPSAIRHSDYIVTASEHPSLKPTLAVDAQNNLHLTWLETSGFGAYRVAYASTTPGVKTAYDRLTLWDATDRALGLAMQFFIAVGLTPVLAIYWSLFPLGWLLIYLLATGREHLTEVGTWAAFGISVLLEVMSTYLYYPHRSRMSPALQWSVPLLTAAIGLLLALLYLRHRDEKPLFGAFFVFAITHGLLQVMCFVLVH